MIHRFQVGQVVVCIKGKWRGQEMTVLAIAPALENNSLWKKGEIIYQMVGGLRSGLSYGGAHNIEELWQNAEFIEITPAGIRESHSHDVKRM